MEQRKASIATTANDKKKKRTNEHELSPHNLSPKKNLSSTMRPQKVEKEDKQVSKFASQKVANREATESVYKQAKRSKYKRRIHRQEALEFDVMVMSKVINHSSSNES